MEWLAGLDLEKVANAIVLLVVGILSGLGFTRGKKNPPPAQASSSVEIAGALVDSSSIKQAAVEISGMTGAMGEQNELMDKGILALDRHRHAVDDLTEQVKELRQVMQLRR